MDERLDVLARSVVWRRTGSPVFVYAARVDRTWWVLRLNDFPDHPLFTLFIGGVPVGDLDDPAGRARGWDLDTGTRAPLGDEEQEEVLTLMRGLAPYGSEVGQPCDAVWCSCDQLANGE
ncbi:hypothetical protein MMF93_00635 [Streptomyces tubbatahanensis]|uniref:Uncharacterized protein n=1 Tax=Streptomyces tubbatahanensis TaxID=2923272 RepID=A0ABY3XL43_9ACTN|nr:hypothetical protein [Streptomyces tubbatahanensis]UNS95130.1 hypothetical protein MMF93_00635 [Streptomyces tubbatahanensis]